MKRYLTIMLILLIAIVLSLLCLKAWLNLDNTGTEGDGSTEDGGTTDGGSTDGGSTDGGSTDGGSTDGGSTDGGSTDGGSTDGGSTDGGSTDGGSTDGDNTDGDNTGGDNTGGDNTGGDNTGGDNTGGEPEPEPEPDPDPIKCETPTLRWNAEEGKLFWAAVEGADGYVLTLKNEETGATKQIALKDCSLTFTDNTNGKLSATIHAVGKNNNFDSDESSEKRFWVGWISVPVR